MHLKISSIRFKSRRIIFKVCVIIFFFQLSLSPFFSHYQRQTWVTRAWNIFNILSGGTLYFFCYSIAIFQSGFLPLYFFLPYSFSPAMSGSLWPNHHQLFALLLFLSSSCHSWRAGRQLSSKHSLLLLLLLLLLYAAEHSSQNVFCWAYKMTAAADTGELASCFQRWWRAAKTACTYKS